MPRSSTVSECRPRLNPGRVLAAAMEMADQDGIEALTMRALGKRLGVEAMSLYNHVAGKDDLLDGLIDIVIGEIELPTPGDTDWEGAIRTCAMSAYDVLLRHPWACPLVMSPPSGGARSTRLRYIEAVLGTFREAGFSAELTYRAYHALDSHVLGFTMWELGHGAVANITPEVAAQLLAIVSSGEYPHLLEHAEQHMSDRSVVEGEFEFGLDLVLEGLKRLHAAELAAGRGEDRRLDGPLAAGSRAAGRQPASKR